MHTYIKYDSQQKGQANIFICEPSNMETLFSQEGTLKDQRTKNNFF